jgi:hypothetical protein
MIRHAPFQRVRPRTAEQKKPFKPMGSEGLHPAFFTLSPCRQDFPSKRTSGGDPRQVFWFPDHPTFRTFPFVSNKQWFMRILSPITAAGPLPISTGFPF